MDTVITKISEIESIAADIMEDANAQKKAYAKEIEERTAAFDKQLETETEIKISALRKNMEEDLESRLSRQRSDAANVLTLMEEHYNKNHGKMAKELFQKMTER